MNIVLGILIPDSMKWHIVMENYVLKIHLQLLLYLVRMASIYQNFGTGIEYVSNKSMERYLKSEWA